MACDDLSECSNQLTGVMVPNDAQRVEFLLNSISSQDVGLQAAMASVRTNTNNMRNDFEEAASHLIEMDPYRRSQRDTSRVSANAQISGIDFKGGRGSSGVDLRWHPRNEFVSLSDAQKTELLAWMKSPAEKSKMRESRKEFNNSVKSKRNHGAGGSGDKQNGGKQNWQKKLKKALKTPNGAASVFSIISQHESNLAAIHGVPMPAQHPPTAPATASATTTQIVPAPAPAVPGVTFVASNQQQGVQQQQAQTRPTDSRVSTLQTLATRYPKTATSVSLQSILRTPKHS